MKEPYGQLNVYAQISANKRKTWQVILFFIGVTAVLFLILGWFVIIVLGLWFFAYARHCQIFRWITRAHPLDPATFSDFQHAAENLSLAAGIPLPEIYLIEDTSPNAFVAGRDPQHAMLAVTCGLLSKLDQNELEGVLAHEFCHIKNYDIKPMSAIAIFFGGIILLADAFLNLGKKKKESWLNWKQSLAVRFIIFWALLLFIFAIAFVILIFVPVTALLTRIMLSGKKDYHADAEAVMLTRYPEGLARALEKMANDPEPLEVSNKAMAHMYIVDPLTRKKGAAPNWLSRLFTTHAPVEKRVEALRAM